MYPEEGGEEGSGNLLPSQYVLLPDPGGPTINCANGMTVNITENFQL